MELRQLRYFVQVAELQSFSRAASAVRIAQPALSRQIRALERELGSELLRRNSRGVTTTDQGTEFLAKAKKILLELDELQTNISQRRPKSQLHGVVSIGLMPLVNGIISAPLIERCRDQLPEVELRISVGYSTLLPECLLRGVVDLAVVFGDVRDKNIHSKTIAADELCFVCSAKSKFSVHKTIRAETIRNLPIALTHRPSPIWTALDSSGIAPAEYVPVENVDRLARLVQDGDYYSILPSSFISLMVAGNSARVIPITEPQVSIPIMLCRPVSRQLSPAALAVAPILETIGRDFSKLVHSPLSRARRPEPPGVIPRLKIASV